MLEILKNRAIIQISGADAQKFLQILTTNDVINQQYTYNYLLNNQGRYLFDFFVYQKTSDNYFIDVSNVSSANLIKLFSLYKLRSDVTIKDVSTIYNIIYSKNILKDAEFSDIDPRYKNLGFRSMILKEKNIEFDNGEENLYLIDKYNNAIIDGEDDLIKDKSIPIEYGADDLNAIDYKKGCYIGQEVISRAKYQGVIRKKIYKLEFAQANPEIKQGSEILDLNDDKIGYVCSNRDRIAIVIIREEKYLGLERKKAIVNNSPADIIIPSWRN
ncbi:MAG: folate-binding protein [Rickettsiales bacterium]|nr:MAG: folate-binding protein [Rickettsiales bacterium]